MIKLTPDQQEQVEDLLERALGLPAEQYSALLKSDCDDPAVHAEVESLLAARPLAERFLDAPIADSAAFAQALECFSSHLDEQNAPIDDPKQIGPYRVISKLGEGGMGTVYLAEQTGPLRRRVAIKFIKAGMDSRSVLARFDAERQALALMNHPNVARVFDAGATEAGRPYFVMEYVQGRRITDHCDRLRLDTDARLGLFVSVCNAIQHAHQKGVIHRDIKPSNVLVAGENGRTAPKVIDFGVAKAIDHRLTEHSLFTEQGILVGTPDYMSPEQIDPTAIDIDTRTDVYSLGLLLYELLVGALPLDSDSYQGVGGSSQWKVFRDQEMPKPSTRLSTLGAAAAEIAQKRRSDTSGLRRLLRRDLDWIVMRCLEKDRERRYATCAELSDDINRYLRHEPVVAGPPSVRYRAGKFVRRNRALVGGGVLVFIVLVAGIISTAVYAVRESRQRLAAQAQAGIAKAANDFLNNMLSSVDPRSQGVDVTVRAVLDAAAARVGIELADHPAEERSVRATIGQSYVALGLYEEAHPHLERALSLAIDLHGNDDPETASSLNKLSFVLKQMGRFAEAETYHRKALAIHRDHFGEEGVRTADSMNHLAQILYDQGKYDEGRPLYERAFEIRTRLLGEQNMDFVTSLNNLSRAYYSDGDYMKAETLLRECLRLMQNLLGNEHVDTIGAMGNVAFMAMANGKYAEAEPMFRDVVDLYRKKYNHVHPDIARALNNLGECVRRQGRYEDAASILREALDMRRETLGEDHPMVAKSLNNLALAIASLERYEEAIALHRESLAIRRKRLGEEHPDVATSLNNLAFALYKTGAFEKARQQYREALTIRRKASGDQHPQVANTQMNLARCLRALGELKEAESLCREALDTQTRMLGEDHPETAATMHELGRILTDVGHYEEAESSLLAGLQIIQGKFGEASSQVREVHEDLVALYEGWGRTEEAANYRRSLVKTTEEDND